MAADLLAVRCPHCGSAPRTRCVVPGDGRQLTHIPAHYARHTAAGIPEPQPSAQVITQMRKHADDDREARQAGAIT